MTLALSAPVLPVLQVLAVYAVDLFGMSAFSGVYSRLMTASGAAGLVGPCLLHRVIQLRVSAGEPLHVVANSLLYVSAGMLAVGLVAAGLLTPVERGRGREGLQRGGRREQEAEKEEEGREDKSISPSIADCESVSLASSLKEPGSVSGDTLLALMVWWAPPLVAFAWGAYVAVGSKPKQ